MEKIKLSENLAVSPIIQGMMRLPQWGLNLKQLGSHIRGLVARGITTFDHADIYGDYSCETEFGRLLSMQSGLRSEIQIITKLGIVLQSQPGHKRKIKHYDYSKKHILETVEKSLRNLQTDYIDLLLLHRPSPFFDPFETSEVLNYLKNAGKVLAFGVSNFNRFEFDDFNKLMRNNLITNQLQISSAHHEHFDNGNLNYLVANKIKPLAWSPLHGGKISNPSTAAEMELKKCLEEVADEFGVKNVDIIALAWLFIHPAEIVPIVGTGNSERIDMAISARSIKLSHEQWFRIYSAFRQQNVP